jgi:hypothetical protein
MALKPISPESAARFTALVIGESGSGKTSLLRTIPPDEPVFVVSAEAGLLCVQDLVESKQVQGVEVASFADMAEVYAFLNSSQASGYKWVFLDSLTEIAARCLEAVKVKYPNRSDSFPMWEFYNAQMTQLIKAYRDLKQYNVVFTALSTTETDDLNRRYIGPLLTGKALKEMIASYFDEVFYLVNLPDANGKEQRALITAKYTCYPAKDRSGKLALVESPHLGEIKRKILGGN